uniref:leucine-rich repeat protein n=1 Tax=Alistipes sp. TaxID=1872444 RepID=UPI00405612AD
CFSLPAFYGKFASSDNRCLIVDGVLNSFAIGCGATEFTVPNSVTSIGNDVFNCHYGLESITIPNSVTSIGDRAFSSCMRLTSVYCKPTTPPTGGYGMFYNNASGRKIYVPRNSVEAYKSADGWKDYADYIEGYDF